MRRLFITSFPGPPPDMNSAGEEATTAEEMTPPISTVRNRELNTIRPPFSGRARERLGFLSGRNANSSGSWVTITKPMSSARRSFVMTDVIFKSSSAPAIPTAERQAARAFLVGGMSLRKIFLPSEKRLLSVQ